MPKSYTHLQLISENDICRVVIHRPRDRNAIDSSLMDEVLDLITTMESTALRALVFTGGGDTYFIGGADGIEMMQCDPSAAEFFSKKIQDLFNRMEESPLILVAAINGLCFGGGFEFAMACDFRIASDTARIGLPEVKVGIIPGGGGTQRLPRLVGTGRAMEMILSGKLYKGQEALAMGLVHRVCPSEQLAEETDNLLRPLLRKPTIALAQAKLTVKACQHMDFTAGLERERAAFKKCFSDDYFVELMCRQLQEGSLETSMHLPDSICHKRRS